MYVERSSKLLAWVIRRMNVPPEETWELQIMSSALFACSVLVQVEYDGKSSGKFKAKIKFVRKYS